MSIVPCTNDERAFRKQFNVALACCVSDRKLIFLRMNTFRDTSSVKMKHNGPSKIIIDPHFIEENERIVMANYRNYASMIEEIFFTQIRRNGCGDSTG